LLERPEWKKSEAVSTIVQMLQVDDVDVRERLVAHLATIEAPQSDKALVDRAVFDLHPEVRKEAVAALSKRSSDGYRPHLLAAFRHPWPAAARHAADACVQLGDTGLIDDLGQLAEMPDPSLAARDDAGRWMKTELVRVNHLANCLLCHPPAETQGTTVGLVAAIPSPEMPISTGGYGESPDRIRSDIVYLRQDFSIVHVTDAYEPWPVLQRYDYLRRTREATPDEIAKAQAASVPSGERSAASYPQRDAVLYALDRLKGTATRPELGPVPGGPTRDVGPDLTATSSTILTAAQASIGPNSPR
jgi:hypothetical protein